MDGGGRDVDVDFSFLNFPSSDQFPLILKLLDKMFILLMRMEKVGATAPCPLYYMHRLHHRRFSSNWN